MLGTILASKYRVLSLLGKGGVGEVYLVENLANHRREAVKILLPEVTDSRLRARFRREAKFAARMRHPSIIEVYSGGEVEDGRLFLAMEYAQGTALNQLIHRGGPLAIPRAMALLAQLADAVDHAHRAGVIHRDLKPHNLIITKVGDDDLLKVCDFGIAKLFGAKYLESIALTRDGEIFGTPAYMAPEQGLSSEPDPRSDIYAIGIIGFEMLVGDPPFSGTPFEIVRAHLTEPAPAPSDLDPDAGIPRALDEVVARALCKKPEERFQSAAEFLAALQEVPGFPRPRPAAQPAATRTPPPVPDEAALTSASPQTPVGDSRALVELAEASLRCRIGEQALAPALGRLRELEMRADATTRRRRELDERRSEIEADAASRHTRLRHAIEQLSVDLDRAAPDARADIFFQLESLQGALTDQQAAGDRALAEIAAMNRALVDEEIALGHEHRAAMEGLARAIEPLMPQVAAVPALASLVAAYHATRQPS